MKEYSDVVMDLDFHFVPSEIPSSPDRKAVHAMLTLLCDNWSHQWQDFFTFSGLKAVFVKQSPHLIHLFWQGLKQGFTDLLPQLNQPEMTDAQILKAQIYVQNCLCFIPFAEPKAGQMITLPEWQTDHFQAVTYRIEPLNLNPCQSSNRFFCHTSDPFCAYGLVPVTEQESVHAKLVFQASSYPAGKGFWQALKSDFNACQTPGADILKKGQQVIDSWVDRQSGPVDFVGLSLGGILAIQAAIANGHINRVHAYNPPGYYHHDKAHRLPEHLPDVHIIRNAGDPISELGRFDARFHIHVLTPAKEYQNNLRLLHHALSFANKASTQVTTLSADTLNCTNQKNDFIYGPLRAAIDYLLLKPLDMGRNLVHLTDSVLRRF